MNQAPSIRTFGPLGLLVFVFHASPVWALHASSDPNVVSDGAAPAPSAPELPSQATEPADEVSDEAASAPSQRAPAPAPVESADTKPEHARAAASCEVSLMSDDLPESCSTPRYGTLTGGYLAIDLGFAKPSRRAANQAAIGAGFALGARLGFELWDTVVLGMGVYAIQPADQRPTSETVVDCTSIQGALQTCDSSGHAKQSEISGGAAATFEAGLQHRFRPWQSLSVSPGAMLGYSAAFSSLKRGVDCEGCAKTDLGLSASGAYTAPFLRVTFGHRGMYAAVARSAWFLSGDLQTVTTLGFEFTAP